MFINNYFTDFMFQEVMVCVTYHKAIKSFIQIFSDDIIEKLNIT